MKKEGYLRFFGDFAIGGDSVLHDPGYIRDRKENVLFPEGFLTGEDRLIRVDDLSWFCLMDHLLVHDLLLFQIQL